MNYYRMIRQAAIKMFKGEWKKKDSWLEQVQVNTMFHNLSRYLRIE